MSSKVAELKRVADELAKATDHVNARLADVQTKLCESRIGVTAGVPILEENGAPLGDLVFSKVGAAWALRWRTLDGATMDLLQAPKKIRFRAAHALNDLLGAIMSAALDQIDEMTRATAELDEWMERMKQ